MKGMLIDITKCVGCNACREACREANHLSDEPAAEPANEPLRAGRYTVVQKRGELFVRRMCMHCAEPTCASVCPVGAFRKTALGPVTYDESRCIGCRYCMVACPFGVPRYEWTARWPKVSKCTMCADRVAAGGQPACAEACPTGATLFGDRDALIAEARRRIAEEPETYFNRVYGLEEVGGTSVLYLSPAPFEQLDMRTDLVREPLPLLTYRVLSKIPHFVGLWGVVLGGVWWITNRREEVANAEAPERATGGGRRKGGRS